MERKDVVFVLVALDVDQLQTVRHQQQALEARHGIELSVEQTAAVLLAQRIQQLEEVARDVNQETARLQLIKG